MIIPLILFTVALAGMLVLLGVRSYELEHNQRTFVTAFGGQFDNKIAEVAIDIKRRLQRISIKKSLVFGSLVLAHAIHDVFHLIKLGAEKVQTQFSSIINLIKGKHSLEKRGASSVYLKHIGEHKKQINGKK